MCVGYEPFIIAPPGGFGGPSSLHCAPSAHSQQYLKVQKLKFVIVYARYINCYCDNCYVMCELFELFSVILKYLNPNKLQSPMTLQSPPSSEKWVYSESNSLKLTLRTHVSRNYFGYNGNSCHFLDEGGTCSDQYEYI